MPVIFHYNSISTLFRLIFSSGNVNHEKINVANQLLLLIPNKKCCTAIVLQQYLSKTGKQEIKSEKQMDTSSAGCIKDSGIMETPEYVKDMLEKMLLDEKSEGKKTGVLVDWLSAIELEMGNSGKQKLQVTYSYSI